MSTEAPELTIAWYGSRSAVTVINAGRQAGGASIADGDDRTTYINAQRRCLR